ncbi:hypothetical protein LCGC14_0474440 [marine sediment metagenome]|uniref:Uncharacterized protein n=1 Tax=marine sediment metagenome TaxID=412755 RepID=A0A0F9SGH1_9ZZZZ
MKHFIVTETQSTHFLADNWQDAKDRCKHKALPIPQPREIHLIEVESGQQEELDG